LSYSAAGQKNRKTNTDQQTASLVEVIKMENLHWDGSIPSSRPDGSGIMRDYTSDGLALHAGLLTKSPKY